jgi:hypothetical protein
MMNHVEHQTLDVTPIEVSVSHDHQTSISKFSQRFIDTTMLQTQNLFQIRKLLIVSQLFYASVPNVPRFPPEWEDAIGIATYDAQTRNRERLG